MQFESKYPCKRTQHRCPRKPPQHCWAQHVASVCMEPQQCWHLLTLVAYSLIPVKLLGPCKRMQDCWPTTPNNTQQCCDLLRPFSWFLKAATHEPTFCREAPDILTPIICREIKTATCTYQFFCLAGIAAKYDLVSRQLSRSLCLDSF